VAAAWGNETMPNPPFGAVLTYQVGATLAAGIGDDGLVLTITNEAGDHVRRIELPEGTGVQRVAWDLRGDPPPPQAEGAGGQGQRGRRGALVEPGRYSAALGRLTGDSVEPLGPSQPVLVVRIQP